VRNIGFLGHLKGFPQLVSEGKVNKTNLMLVEELPQPRRDTYLFNIIQEMKSYIELYTYAKIQTEKERFQLMNKQSMQWIASEYDIEDH
jgi:hypothetical protein